jgi:hypothetical protein
MIWRCTTLSLPIQKGRKSSQLNLNGLNLIIGKMEKCFAETVKRNMAGEDGEKMFMVRDKVIRQPFVTINFSTHEDCDDGFHLTYLSGVLSTVCSPNQMKPCYHGIIS